MKKKGLKTMAVSAAAGCCLLSLSITAFAATGSGYESYKGGVKSIVLAENETVSTQFEVKDNGSVIFSGDSTEKVNQENRSSKSNITVDGVKKTYESSADNGNYVINADGKYYTINRGDKKSDSDKREKLSESSSTVKLAEMITDTLVGDVKNQFVMDGQTISVKLEGAQIPELAKLAISAAAENNSMGKHKNSDKIGDDGMKAAMDKVPKLSNIDVKSIAMTATVDGNTLKDNKLSVTITGKDANGVSHDISVMLNAKITDLGNTKIDSIDTTGKEVNTIDWTQNHHQK
ncbi:hypothetical protein [Clostridium magnum]|uniref:Uncharacterized protein n=1 Tax=Clostridium magnum DSM 2767 TaxID=1121326 RepID=A0A162SQ22_9CLOT|nr:hypothetical protein [Clostridium magnum]KZL91720.1 hypothetical protein CLMAG_34790 [Clostridium magnum DSM 2767]SHJ04399.1 hypothetical protein SAMN02745944_05271 [Clostridium magnum DSM 2767]